MTRDPVADFMALAFCACIWLALFGDDAWRTFQAWRARRRGGSA